MLFALLCSIPSVAQKADTAFISASAGRAQQLYTNAFQGQARLFNGTEYRLYQSRNDEFPLYLRDDWTNGAVLYDGEHYDNVSLVYDISTDKVVVEHMLNGAEIQLIAEKVSWFSMSGHTFVRIDGDKTNGVKSGFYDLLYDGPSKVYAKREKMLQESIESQVIVSRFEEKNHLYILRNGVFVPVKKKSSVLKVFSDRKSDVKSALNKSKIRFRKDREKAIVLAATFYDSPKN
ncbi:hypothetical protein JI741_28295 [Chryseolinea sp. Jin1]|uniref:Uncharacterized protein n=2 Tax=Chryseolinea lacunae TaxID=2801331 RepID=A0ABS1L0E5_9BACT|nr:hypothetical protein [Chryseolinea lacunae]